MKQVELLAPAGNYEALEGAICAGADAVYLAGNRFGARAYADNFTEEELCKGIRMAHIYGRRIYLTVNILVKEAELPELVTFLQPLYEAGLDGVIVQDLGAVQVIRRYFPHLPVHASTQMTITGPEGARFLKEQGICRIVPARELSLKEIRRIREETGIEIETFIHGAMCSSISGRCVLSNFLTNRDSNRGGCSQICRWDFKLLDEQKKNIEGEKDFTLCAKDLSLLAYIKDMMDIGITSFKIEGRMRSIYYIATVVDIYRRVIDGYLKDSKYQYPKDYEKILRNCANRDAVSQFFNEKNDVDCQYYNGREEISNQDFLGIVLDYDKENKLATVEERNYFKKDDEVEIFGPNKEIISLKLNEIYDENDNLIEIVRHPRQVVKIRIDSQVEPYDLIRIKK